MADIILIAPKFRMSFWGMEAAVPFIGKRANMPPAGLALLGALTPEHHRVTVMDENIELLDYDRIARADIVGLTGMMPQRRRMAKILQVLTDRRAGKGAGPHIVVGGPWISVDEGYFGALPDTIVVGEAEETWPKFLADWEAGRPERRYEQAGKTDMATVPPPRLDLLKMDKYAFGSLQFSRGCPFTCEFCDIIVVFGRRPRVKTAPQVIAELEQFRRLKTPLVFIVDDNLIGNRPAIKSLLAEVIAWQERNGYPLTFLTETSIDLADDPELMRLMADANISSVFVGIESVNEASLRETKKLQNVRAGGTMAEKVRRIQDAGIEVMAGMIAGFDADDASVFESHRRFLGTARIAEAIIGMLSAIPRTPLYARLATAGRIDEAGTDVYGANIVPAQMSREQLRDGYVQLMRDLYRPEPYFERLDALYLDGGFTLNRGWRRYAARHPWRRLWRNLVYSAQSLAMTAGLVYGVRKPGLRAIYLRQILRGVKKGIEPSTLRHYVYKCVAHHHYQVVAHAIGCEGAVINSF